MRESEHLQEINRAKQKEETKKIKNAEALIDTCAKKGIHLEFKVIDDLKAGKLDAEEYIKKLIEDHEKKRNSLEERLKRTGKELDWFERAKRQEEKTLLQSSIKQFLAKDEIIQKKEEIEKAKKKN